MHFMEKMNWAALIVGLAALGWYALQIVPDMGVMAVDEIAWKGPMIQTLLGFLALLIAAIVIVAILDHKTLAKDDIVDDERDHSIERRGDAWSGHVLHAFAFLALVLLFLDAHVFWVANAIFLGSMLSGAIGLVIRVVQYRTGA